MTMMMMLMMIGGLEGWRTNLGFTWRQNGCKKVTQIDLGGCAGVILGCVRVVLAGLGD